MSTPRIRPAGNQTAGDLVFMVDARKVEGTECVQ
jgi:hypothetical protein